MVGHSAGSTTTSRNQKDGPQRWLLFDNARALILSHDVASREICGEPEAPRLRPALGVPGQGLCALPTAHERYRPQYSRCPD